MTSSHLSDKLRYALLDMRTINPQLPITSPLRHFTFLVHPNKPKQQPVIGNQIALQLKSTPQKSRTFPLLSTNFQLKNKEKMFYFPMDSGHLTIDGLIDTGALSSAISETDLKQIKQIPPKNLKRSPTRFSYRGGQQTIGNTCSNNRSAIQSW